MAVRWKDFSVEPNVEVVEFARDCESVSPVSVGFDGRVENVMHERDNNSTLVRLADDKLSSTQENTLYLRLYLERHLSSAASAHVQLPSTLQSSFNDLLRKGATVANEGISKQYLRYYLV